jgi:lipopolysaccharide export system protein LptA
MPAKRPPSAGRRLRLLSVAGLMLLPGGLPTHSQPTVGGSITGGWKLPQYDDANRLRSLISGQSVQALPGSTTLRVEALRLEFFREDGAVEFVAEAPDCTFDLQTRIASSAGPLRARTADQRLVLSGTGFLARPDTSTLVLSNAVRALVQPDTGMTGGARLPLSPAGTHRGGVPMEITAATFEINLTNRAAMFRDRVRAHDPQFELTAGLLTARFTGTNGTLEAIEAERDVEFFGRADDSRVTAQQARYTLADDTIVLSGNPRFRQREREGRAQSVRYFRPGGVMEAVGEVALRAPRETISRTGFLLAVPDETNAPAPAVNSPNAPAWVELFSQRLTTRSNLTVLEGAVQLVDGSNRLQTARLTLETEGTNRAPARVRAEDGVRVEQGVRWVQARTGVYERAGESLTFHGRPEWRLDDVAGVADTLKLFPRTNALEAAGDLRLTLPLQGGVGALLPVFTNAASVPGRTNPPVEVTARRLVLTNDVLALTGGVQGRELPATGAEKRFAASQVLIELAPGRRRATAFAAYGDVVVEQGRPGVTNGPAAYRRFEAGEVRAGMSAATGALESLTAQIGVRVQQPGGWAAGDQAEYSAQSDIVELRGRPTARFADLQVTEAQALLWHRGSNTLEVMAPYKLQVLPRSGDAGTNTVPKLFFR